MQHAQLGKLVLKSELPHQRCHRSTYLILVRYLHPLIEFLPIIQNVRGY